MPESSTVVVALSQSAVVLSAVRESTHGRLKEEVEFEKLEVVRKAPLAKTRPTCWEATKQTQTKAAEKPTEKAEERPFGGLQPRRRRRTLVLLVCAAAQSQALGDRRPCQQGNNQQLFPSTLVSRSSAVVVSSAGPCIAGLWDFNAVIQSSWGAVAFF